MATVTVGAAQIMARFNDFEGNLALIDQFAGQAARAGVEVLLFSEDVLHGSTIAREAVALALPLDSPHCEQVSALARHHGVVLLVGFIERLGDVRYNSHLIARPDGTRMVQRKHALNKRELDNGLTPAPVDGIPFELNGRRCHIAICADWGSTAFQNEVDRHACEILFLPTAGGGTKAQLLTAAALKTAAGIVEYTERMRQVAFPFEMISYCLRKRRAVVACNSVGDNGFDMCQQGHCTIMSHTGELRGLIPGAPVIEYQRSDLIYAVL